MCEPGNLLPLVFRTDSAAACSCKSALLTSFDKFQGLNLWVGMSLLHCDEQFMLQVAPKFFKNGSVGDADFKNAAAKASNVTSGRYTLTCRPYDGADTSRPPGGQKVLRQTPMPLTECMQILPPLEQDRADTRQRPPNGIPMHDQHLMQQLKPHLRDHMHKV